MGVMLISVRVHELQNTKPHLKQQLLPLTGAVITVRGMPGIPMTVKDLKLNILVITGIA
jgi:hypothetical protein